MRELIYLQVFGPFDIAFDAEGHSKFIRAEHGTAFWSQPTNKPLAPKQGVYVFAIRAGRGFTPWYVGRATKGFGQEVFTPHKREHFNDALRKVRKGNPVLFLVARPGSRNKVPFAEIVDMETQLTQDALLENPDLRNIQNTKNLPRWAIAGLIRTDPGRPTTPTMQFGKMLGLK